MVGHLAQKARDAGLSPTQHYTFRLLKNSLWENYLFIINYKWIENAYLDMTVDSLAQLHMCIVSEMSNAHAHSI